MENCLHQAEHKLKMIFQHVPTGLAEIDNCGKIIHLNVKGEALLKPVLISNDFDPCNLFPVLEEIAPSVAQLIRRTTDDAGYIITNELHSFFLTFGGEKIERHFNFTVVKIHTDCIVIGFDDLTQKSKEEKAIQRLRSDKAVMQGKLEIASNILHDIGNAVVGLGSYTSRINRSMENTHPQKLQKLTDFLHANQAPLDTAFGEVKAGAILAMLKGIGETQRKFHDETSSSLNEQLNILTHIQDILNIQRQYSGSHESQERTAVNLRSIITDCLSMLFASLEKRSIKVSINFPESLPVINGDRTRLMQVILNLLKNSIEAIDINSIEKTISLSISVTDGRLVLETRDSGHGFDAITGTQLFKRGFTTKVSGSGIGLDSCKDIIENHEGTIDITSEGYGKGTLTTLKFKI